MVIMSNKSIWTSNSSGRHTIWHQGYSSLDVWVNWENRICSKFYQFYLNVLWVSLDFKINPISLLHFQAFFNLYHRCIYKVCQHFQKWVPKSWTFYFSWEHPGRTTLSLRLAEFPGMTPAIFKLMYFYLKG